MSGGVSYEQVLFTMRKNLKYLLNNGSMNMTVLAELTDLSRSFVSRWSSGKTKPSLKVILSVADVYNLTLDEFCYTDLEAAAKENIHVKNVVPTNDDDALGLAMFQSLSQFDRESILRIMQTLCTSSSVSGELVGTAEDDSEADD